MQLLHQTLIMILIYYIYNMYYSTSFIYKGVADDVMAVGCLTTPCGCDQVFNKGCVESGVYTMDCGCGPFKAYCEMGDNSALTVFQRRFNGVERFYRNWIDYESGFGNPSGEHWLGLKQLHSLTNTYPGVRLRVDLEDWDGHKYYAEYSHFTVGDSTTGYVLNVSGYSGNAGDRLAYHNGHRFTTYDKDNDGVNYNCAVAYRGGWWYYGCHHSNLNGEYFNSGVDDAKGVGWRYGKPQAPRYYSFKAAEMKMRLNDGDNSAEF